jgi:glycosyltransferase involved in cell wall biosynthesis
MHFEISVLMSVYNSERFLREAVDSILAQTYKNFEFVIVNDGSRDATAEILAAYKDPRLRIFTIENRGLPAALNYGLERCRADLVMRMDADDIAYSERFAIQIEDWEKADRPDVFGSGADYINEEGDYLWSVTMPLDDAAIRSAIRDPNGELAVIHPTVLFRKSAVLLCGGYDPYFKNGQDYDLWLRMTTRFRFGNSPRRLLKYRFQSSSDTARYIQIENGTVNLGNWMKLISLQKKLMIDAGEEEAWYAGKDRIICALMKRVDISALQAEAIFFRYLTESKVLLYSRRRRRGLLQLLTLFMRHPDLMLKRFMGRHMTGMSKYLLTLDEIKQLSTHENCL